MDPDISHCVVPEVGAVEIDRLAVIYNDDDRDALFRKAIRVMAARGSQARTRMRVCP